MNYFAELGEALWADYCPLADGYPQFPSSGALDVRPADRRDLAFLRALIRSRRAVPMGRLLDHVGRSPRMDLLAALLADQSGRTDARALQTELRPRLLERGATSERTASLLDLATDQALTPLPLPEVVAMIKDSTDRTVSRAALRHLLVFPSGTADEELVLRLGNWLSDDHEVLTWMVVACARGHDQARIGEHLARGRQDVLRFFPRVHQRQRKGILVLQQVASLGAMNEPGEGEVGGLAVFLSSLGDALAAQDGIAAVVTVNQISVDELARSKGWIEGSASDHAFLGLPTARTDMARAGAEPPLSEITWWLLTLLPTLGLVPDVAHLRFGSDVTLAMARAIRKLGSRVTFTIAPDPHRTILELHQSETGDLDREGLSHDLHRLFAAETLSDWADSAIAIPSARQDEETARFFPNVVKCLGGVEAVPEGVTAWEGQSGDAVAGERLLERLFEQNGVSGLSAENVGSPVMLNVGRWNRLKQQDVLVAAWLRSLLFESTMLVLVGGSFENPTDVEAGMRRRVTDLLAAAPDGVRGRFAWVPRLPNRDVRLLERALITHCPTSSQHVYVCSSVKEEFGISVLEAMDAGLLAIAPRRGGASHYIQHGATGFLADTSSEWGFATDISSVLGASHSAPQLQTIARAGQRRVRTDFGIDRSARRFAEHYLGLLER